MPDNTTPVQQWEYADRCVDHVRETNYQSILSKMREMGLEGWECVGIYEGIIYFKRATSLKQE